MFSEKSSRSWETREGGVSHACHSMRREALPLVQSRWVPSGGDCRRWIWPAVLQKRRSRGMSCLCILPPFLPSLLLPYFFLPLEYRTMGTRWGAREEACSYLAQFWEPLCRPWNVSRWASTCWSWDVLVLFLPTLSPPTTHTVSMGA